MTINSINLFFNSSKAISVNLERQKFINYQALTLIEHIKQNQMTRPQLFCLWNIIEQYKIEDQPTLYKVKTAVNEFCASLYFLENKEEDQKENHVFEVVKKLVEYCSEEVSIYFRDYKLEEEDNRIDIAKRAALKNPKALSQYIQNYEIKNNKALIEIAKIMIDNNGSSFICDYVVHTAVKETSFIIEVGKVLAASYEGGRQIDEYLNIFEIKDEKQIAEIAKFAATEERSRLSENIQFFGIKDEKTLTEIAKITAAQDAWNTSEYIENYGIQDEKELIEIAKISAAQDGDATSEYIENYGIQDEKELIEIAKISAAQNGGGTSEHIKNYKIQDEKERIKIVKIAVAQDVKGTSSNIQNYKITDEKEVIKIAKIAAAHNIEEVLKYIHYYGIEDQKVLSTLLYIGYSSRWILHIELGDLQITQLANLFTKEKILQSDLKSIVQSLNTHFASSDLKNLAAALLKNLSMPNISEKKLHALENQAFWLLSLSIYVTSQGIALDQLKGVENFLNDLMRHPDPVMRDKLTILLFDSFSPQLLSWGKNINFSPTKGYTSLPSLILFVLLGETQTDLAHALLRKFFHSKSSDYGEYQKNFIRFLDKLCENTQLSKEKKVELLNKVFDDQYFTSNAGKKHSQHQELSAKFNEVLKAMEFASILCDFNQLQKIESIKDLALQLAELYKDLEITTEDMQTRYLNTLGKFRNRHALLTYFGTLRRLLSPQKEEATKMLKQFAREVLDQTFTTKRYENSPHLDVIATHFPALLELWKKGAEILIQREGAAQSPRNYHTFFFQKLIHDQHLGSDFEKKYPLLFEYLKNPINNSIDLQKVETGSFEEYCFHLMNGHTPEKEVQILENLLTTIPVKAEFRKDIEGLLKTSSQKQQDIKIVDTDDPCDLLQLGEEVPGSCQRLLGDPKNNVGLLGYLLDGKIRAIVVKGKDGKILGRSLIRLLWDRQKHQVVLQQDRYYGNEKYQQLVNEGCKGCAAQLNIPLVVEQATAPYFLESLGGRCPFEYVDSLGAPARGPIYVVPVVTIGS